MECFIIQLWHLVLICTIWCMLKLLFFYINYQYLDFNIFHYTSFVLLQSLSFCFNSLYDAFEKLYWLKFIAFVCNVKRSAIAVPFFFLFLSHSTVFGWTAKSFLTNILRLVTMEAYDQPKHISVKVVP